MANIEKKIKKLEEQIAETETALRTSLTKKTHNSPEIDVAAVQRKLSNMREQLSNLKAHKK